MAESKLQIGVYKIEDKVVLADLSDSILAKGYSAQELELTKKNYYDLSLFYCRKNSNLKWKNFLQGIARANQDILKQISKTEGFVLLLSKESNGCIYAVTGGIGYFAIQEYIDSEFGIDIISRLISKEDKIIKATKENSVMGGILGSIKYFRTNYNLYENDSFGKIYQELKTSLNKDILVGKFGLNEEDIKKDSVCIAKSSFKLNKALSFEQMLSIIDGCESVIEYKEPIVINAVSKVIKKKNVELINQLDEELFNQLWRRFTKQEKSFMFDLCHKEFEKYLTAARYEIRKNQSTKNLFSRDDFTILDDIDLVFEKIENSKLIDAGDDKNEFVNLLSRLKIYSFDEEGKELTKWPLIYHIFGDVEYDDKRYFYINNVWYRIKDDFIESLNKSCDDFTQKNWFSDLGYTWDYFNNVNENEFNSQFIGEENIIILDKIIPDNIEPCDILKWDDEHLYFIHVKAGFGNTMRDLCSQVLIAANKIIHDLNAEKKYIEQIYCQLKNGIGSNDQYFNNAGKQTENYTKEQFLELFNTKTPVFVLAVFDTASSDRNLKIADNFKSNIAKFSLQELVKEMKGLGIGLNITQIKRP